MATPTRLVIVANMLWCLAPSHTHTGPTAWPPCMDSPIRKTFTTRVLHIHGPVASILLVWSSHQVEPDYDTNCYVTEGGKHREDLHQWAMSNHISELDTTPWHGQIYTFTSYLYSNMFLSLYVVFVFVSTDNVCVHLSVSLCACVCIYVCESVKVWNRKYYIDYNLN